MDDWARMRQREIQKNENEWEVKYAYTRRLKSIVDA